MKKRIIIWLLLAGILTSGLAIMWWSKQATSSDPTPVALAPKPAAANTDTSSQIDRKSPLLGNDILGLPEYCSDKLFSVAGCDGMTEISSEQGNTYRLVEIGDQCWFADNLKEIPTTGEGWYGYYDNAVEESAPGEGLLYTWEAAMNGEIIERAQGICPIGWHIPTECEQSMVANNLEFIPSSYPGRRSLDAEGNLQIGNAPFTGRGYLLYIWSSSNAQRGPSVLWQVRRNSASVINGNPQNTYSARCIRD